MPSLHHGAIFIGVFLIVTGGSTAFLGSNQNKLHAFSLCCVVMGAMLLILGLFWAMKEKLRPGISPNDYGHVLFTPPSGSHIPESQAVLLQRRLDRMRWVRYHENDFDFPPSDPVISCPGRPPHWDLEAPPSYEMAMKTTKSSTHLRRCYSDTQLPSEPLFGESREISFEV